MREADIQKSIKDWINASGGYAVKVASGAAYSAQGQFMKLSESGTPDILAAINGRFVAIEVKLPTGKLSDSQIYRLREIHKRKIDWIVACSCEDIQKYERDNSHHGDSKFTALILDESTKFVMPPHRKSQNMSMDTLLKFNNWSDKRWK